MILDSVKEEEHIIVEITIGECVLHAILFCVFIDKHCIFENLIDTSAFNTMIVCRFQSFSKADTLKFDDDVKSMHIGFVILIIVRDKIFNVTRM